MKKLLKSWARALPSLFIINNEFILFFLLKSDYTFKNRTNFKAAFVYPIGGGEDTIITPLVFTYQRVIERGIWNALRMWAKCDFAFCIWSDEHNNIDNDDDDGNSRWCSFSSADSFWNSVITIQWGRDHRLNSTNISHGGRYVDITNLDNLKQQ